MRFFLEHIDELLPIAIFLIVMIYSAMGNKKRPSRPPAPAPERDDSGYQYDTPDAPPPPHPARAPQGGGEAVDDELRRMLGDIFAAKRPQQPAPAQTPRSNDSEWQESVAARKIKDAKKAAAKAEAKAVQRAVDRAPTLAASQANLAYAIQAQESADAPSSEYASAEQARAGIIWTEILQRPLALR